MAYTNLKEAIASVIKTNGRRGITGANLQAKLFEIIDALGAGYQFMGVATSETEPGNPDGNVFYLAEAGSYPNFNSIDINDGMLGILMYTDGTWKAEQIEIGVSCVEVGDSVDSSSDFEISDENNNVLLRCKTGHFLTKYFDSSNVYNKNEVDEKVANDGIVNGNSYSGRKVDISTHKFSLNIIEVFSSTGKNMQGFAVFGNTLVSLSDTGICQMASYDGITVVELSRFNLASYGSTNHANCASFGLEIPSGYDLPYLYVARCYTGYRTCLVERLESNSSTLMQTISVGTYKGDVDANSDIQYVVSDDGFLYIFGNTKSAFDVSGNKFVMAKFPLPPVSGDVQLNLNDAIEFYYMEDYGYSPGQVLQGCCIKNGLMFLPIGYGTVASPSQLLIWNLGDKRIQNCINLSQITTGEIEDCAIWRDKLMVRYGNGNLYLIQF